MSHLESDETSENETVQIMQHNGHPQVYTCMIVKLMWVGDVKQAINFAWSYHYYTIVTILLPFIEGSMDELPFIDESSEDVDGK